MPIPFSDVEDPVRLGSAAFLTLKLTRELTRERRLEDKREARRTRPAAWARCLSSALGVSRWSSRTTGYECHTRTSGARPTFAAIWSGG